MVWVMQAHIQQPRHTLSLTFSQPTHLRTHLHTLASADETVNVLGVIVNGTELSTSNYTLGTMGLTISNLGIAPLPQQQVTIQVISDDKGRQACCSPWALVAFSLPHAHLHARLPARRAPPHAAVYPPARLPASLRCSQRVCPAVPLW